MARYGATGVVEFALPDGEGGSFLPSVAEGGPAEGERPPRGPPALHVGRGATSQLRRRLRVLRKVARKISPGNLKENRQRRVNSMYGTNKTAKKTL